MKEDIMSNEKLYGTVCWFSKGYGFITPDDGSEDKFVHFSDLQMEGFRTLSKGQRVCYEMGLNKHGQPKAVNVVVLKH